MLVGLGEGILEDVLSVGDSAFTESKGEEPVVLDDGINGVDCHNGVDSRGAEDVDEDVVDGDDDGVDVGVGDDGDDDDGDEGRDDEERSPFSRTPAVVSSVEGEIGGTSS